MDMKSIGGRSRPGLCLGGASSSSLIHSLRGRRPSRRASAPLRCVRRYEVETEACERIEGVRLGFREGAECLSRRTRARLGTRDGATFSTSARRARCRPRALAEVGERVLAMASAHVSVKGDSIEIAREERGVVGKGLQGVVGADERASLSDGALGGDAAESERERACVGTTGSSARGAGLGWGSERRDLRESARQDKTRGNRHSPLAWGQCAQ